MSAAPDLRRVAGRLRDLGALRRREEAALVAGDEHRARGAASLADREARDVAEELTRTTGTAFRPEEIAALGADELERAAALIEDAGTTPEPEPERAPDIAGTIDAMAKSVTSRIETACDDLINSRRAFAAELGERVSNITAMVAQLPGGARYQRSWVQ